MASIATQSLWKRFIQFSYGSIGRGVIGVISFPILSWLILPYEFGKAAIFTALSSLIVIIIQLGIDQGYAREYHLQQNKKKLLQTSLAPLLITWPLASILILTFKRDLIHFFGQGNFYQIPYLFIATIFIAPFIYLPQIIFIMEKRAKTSSFVLIFWRLFDLIFTILFLIFFSKTFLSIIYGQVLSALVTALLSIYLTKNHWAFTFAIDTTLLKKIFNFSYPFILYNIFQIGLLYQNHFLLKRQNSLGDVGIYESALKVSFIFILGFQSFNKYWTSTQYQWLKSKVPAAPFNKTNEILAVIFTIIFATLFLSKGLIFSIISPQYADAQYVFPFICLGIVAITFSSGVNYAIKFSRKTHWIILISLTTLFLNFFLAKSLIPISGPQGAAQSFAMATLINYIFQALISRWVWPHPLSQHQWINLALMSSLCFFPQYQELIIAIMIIANIKSIIKMFKEIRLYKIFSRP